MNEEKSKKIRVLMVTGVYYPETNGAVLQCMQLIKTIGNLIKFSVLTSSSIQVLTKINCVEDVSVYRVLIGNRLKIEYFFSAIKFIICLIWILRKTDLVHIHGFSKRNAVVIAVSRAFNKKVILKMTSFGQDDPLSIRKEFPISWKLFKCCHAYIGISPAFFGAYKETGLSESKYNFIPNGVDLNLFSPASIEQKKKLKSKYGYKKADKILLFVGHFSIDKRPFLAYRTWLLLHQLDPNVKLIFIGRTQGFYEVDNSIVNTIKIDASNRGLDSFVNFVEQTFNINEFMKISDVFLLPSTREGLPNVLLEAMACSLPCFVTNIPGVTDWLVDDEISGFLLKSDEPSKWAEKIMPYVIESRKSEVGSKARQFVENNFSFNLTSVAVNDLYNKII